MNHFKNKKMKGGSKIIFLLAALIFLNKEVAGKAETTIQLSFYKDAAQNRTVVAKVTERNAEGKLLFVQGVTVKFYAMQPAGQTFLKSSTTGVDGRAVLQLSETLQKSPSGALQFIARIEDNEKYANSEAEGSVEDARVDVNLSVHDTMRMITATVKKIQADGAESPAAGVEVNFGVKRLFGTLALGENSTVTTDEKGMAVFEFPKEIKGDENGKVVFVVHIDDNEMFGNIESITSADWGIHSAVEKNPFPRALWEPNAPWSLIIPFTLIFGSIWFTYVFVIFQLFKLDKKI